MTGGWFYLLYGTGTASEGIIGIALKIAAFTYIWLLAIPLGLIGFAHLAIQEQRGYGTTL